MGRKIFTGLMMFALALGCACCHVARNPPSAGFYGQVHAGKPVYCVIDDDFTDEQCLATVVASIGTINAAVGYELLHYAGTRVVNSPGDVPAKERDVVMVGVGELLPGTLGVTMPRAMDGVYILGTVILLSPDAFEAPYTASDVALHELLHALGMAHAEQDSAFPSQEKPHAQPTLHGLTPNDVSALLAAYGR